MLKNKKLTGRGICIVIAQLKLMGPGQFTLTMDMAHDFCYQMLIECNNRPKKQDSLTFSTQHG